MTNVITAIDPKTGEKTINPASIPPPESRQLSLPGICPDTLGARNWMATSYDASRRTLFIPMTDTCVDRRTGVRWQKQPDPSTDGKYGIFQAASLDSRRVVWSRREDAPLAGAALAPPEASSSPARWIAGSARTTRRQARSSGGCGWTTCRARSR